MNFLTVSLAGLKMTAEEKLKEIKEFIEEKEKQDWKRREKKWISCGEYLVLKSFICELRGIIDGR